MENAQGNPGLVYHGPGCSLGSWRRSLEHMICTPTREVLWAQGVYVNSDYGDVTGRSGTNIHACIFSVGLARELFGRALKALYVGGVQLQVSAT